MAIDYEMPRKGTDGDHAAVLINGDATPEYRVPIGATESLREFAGYVAGLVVDNLPRYPYPAFVGMEAGGVPNPELTQLVVDTMVEMRSQAWLGDRVVGS